VSWIESAGARAPPCSPVLPARPTAYGEIPTRARLVSARTLAGRRRACRARSSEPTTCSPRRCPGQPVREFGYGRACWPSGGQRRRWVESSHLRCGRSPLTASSSAGPLMRQGLGFGARGRQQPVSWRPRLAPRLFLECGGGPSYSGRSPGAAGEQRPSLRAAGNCASLIQRAPPPAAQRGSVGVLEPDRATNPPPRTAGQVSAAGPQSSRRRDDLRLCLALVRHVRSNAICVASVVLCISGDRVPADERVGSALALEAAVTGRARVFREWLLPSLIPAPAAPHGNHALIPAGRKQARRRIVAPVTTTILAHDRHRPPFPALRRAGVRACCNLLATPTSPCQTPSAFNSLLIPLFECGRLLPLGLCPFAGHKAKKRTAELESTQGLSKASTPALRDRSLVPGGDGAWGSFGWHGRSYLNTAKLFVGPHLLAGLRWWGH